MWQKIKNCRNVLALFLLVGISILLTTLPIQAKVRMPRPDDVWMSPTGNDANEGNQTSPVATFERVRDIVRQKRKAGHWPASGITVWLREGTYSQTKTFELRLADSGTPAGPFQFSAVQGAQVKITGGVEIPLGPVFALDRLPVDALPQIRQVDLKALGITDFGEITPRGYGHKRTITGLEVYQSGRRLSPAQWPNKAPAKVATTVPQTAATTFHFTEDNPLYWSRPNEIWLRGHWTWDWAESWVKLLNIDSKQKIFTTTTPPAMQIFNTGRPYYAVNVIEELDAPGEWYLDRVTGILSVIPDGPAPVTVSVLTGPIISIRDAVNVQFTNIIFDCSRGPALEFIGGSNLTVSNCRFRNLGGSSIVRREMAGNARERVDLQRKNWRHSRFKSRI